MPPRYSTRSSQRMMSTQVKVTSYNVLSSHLAAPQYFRACKPEFLDAKYRLESLKSKLESECATNAVICLQEVSHTWSGKLHAFFAERNYHFVTALYGNRFDNYMGIAIAVPIAKYDLLDVNIQKVSDTKVMPPKVKPTFLGGLLLSLQSWVLKVATMLRLYKAPFDVWYNILYRHNQMLCARLRDKETAKSFIVSTYHMPCMFQYPSVMVAHTALSAQHALKYATQVAVEDQKKIAKATEETNASSSSTESPDENVATAAVVPDPIIFCGDYNFKPESSMYQVITHGGLESRHPDIPPVVDNDSWKPALQVPFGSAYKEKNGVEPNFTNYAKVKDDPEFIDTLDYIFYAPKDAWQVDDVLPLPDRSEVAGPLPNENEPSDHILISATMTLTSN